VDNFVKDVRKPWMLERNYPQALKKKTPVPSREGVSAFGTEKVSHQCWRKKGGVGHEKGGGRKSSLYSDRRSTVRVGLGITNPFERGGSQHFRMASRKPHLRDHNRDKFKTDARA